MKLRCFVSSGMLCLLTMTIPIAASAQVAPRTPHHALPEIDYTGHRIARIVVKFRDDSGIRAVGGTAQLAKDALGPSSPLFKKELGALNQTVAAAGLRIDALFSGKEAEFALERERATATWGRQTADLPTYLQIAVPGRLPHKTIRQLEAPVAARSSRNFTSARTTRSASAVRHPHRPSSLAQPPRSRESIAISRANRWHLQTWWN